MKSILKKAVFVALSLSFAHTAFAAAAIDGLGADDQNSVKNGNQVTKTAPGQGSPWPQVWVYQRIDATPEDAMAVFADYNRQSEYVPDIVYSKVTKQIDKATAEVSYSLATHFFLHPHEDYTVRDHVSSYDNGASYRMDWTLVSADTTRGTVGNARFEALGTGTLLAYYNFVTPPGIAGGEGAKEVSGVQASVAKIVERIQATRVANQSLIQQELAALRAALAP